MQRNIWEEEYKQGKLLSKSLKPQKDFFRLMKIIKKRGFDIEDKKVLDLGAGTGRNGIYLAELGAAVTAMEISEVAIKMGKDEANKVGVQVDFINESIGGVFPMADNEFDLVLDLTASNSLDEKEREIYIKEVSRVLKSDGYFLVRTLTKEGDKNAKQLLKLFPAEETDTYILPEINLKEHVWSRDDFKNFYSKGFEIIEMWSKEGYYRMNNRAYKRKYILAVMSKK
ncbi:TPA: hypothetical protein DF272_00400 [Candidatus Falkowbacteria bacterium]|nr:hypothetical protein [Candidatus Falkowbacteria bacterium]